jgi:hypothetical protein
VNGIGNRLLMSCLHYKSGKRETCSVMFDATLQNAVLIIDDAALIVKVAVLKVQLYSRTSAVAVRVCAALFWYFLSWWHESDIIVQLIN